MDVNQFVFQLAQQLPGFLMAIVAHEWAHGRMALKYGDDTAMRSGRLTLNPAAHIDMMGTVVFPLILLAIGGYAFGWAKPVPVNTRNLKPIDKGIFWVAFAGPLANMIICVISSFCYAILVTKFDGQVGYVSALRSIFLNSIYINVVIGVFNLIPLPPLDGSKMLASKLSYQARVKYQELAAYAQYIFIGMIVLSFMGIPTISYIFIPFQRIAQFLTMAFIHLLG
jgi:Zn-dependent protease